MSWARMMPLKRGVGSEVWMDVMLRIWSWRGLYALRKAALRAHTRSLSGDPRRSTMAKKAFVMMFTSILYGAMWRNVSHIVWAGCRMGVEKWQERPEESTFHH
ncbi:hypothetical protein GMDG_08454 [Pseudogymnoascus destructans 20631-21]|uniref:Uncharacterized protein n=1 Tax=Pseudogymnoascus destructans (strain ATCC MYA-4855 / 20631-21) TaxID=658429 RepID=L8G407_PSED2|nr:hypothetical protein GMDG_08454 [Pseudogymnoascus destructans 20631-21]